MANVGDIYFLRTEISLGNNEVAVNVYHYEVTAGGETLTAQEVAEEFDTEVLANLETFMTNTRIINDCYCINSADNADFYQFNPNRQGDVAGIPLPPVVAMGVRSPWPGPGFNRASKRLPIGTIGSLTGDGEFSIGYADTLDQLTDQLGITLEAPGGSVAPVTVVGSFQLGVPLVRRAFALGRWEMSLWPTTQKGRQQYLWYLPAAP